MKLLKIINLRFSDLELNWCEGIIPLEDGVVELRWKKKDGKIYYKLSTPAGYTVNVKNIGSCELIRVP